MSSAPATGRLAPGHRTGGAPEINPARAPRRAPAPPGAGAGAADVVAHSPQVVVVATGGLPDVEALESGNELAVSCWDIISGSVKPCSNVLLFDDVGDHAGLQAAEIIAASGAKAG